MCPTAATGNRTLGTRLCLSRDLQVHGEVVIVQKRSTILDYASKVGDNLELAECYFSEIPNQAST